MTFAFLILSLFASLLACDTSVNESPLGEPDAQSFRGNPNTTIDFEPAAGPAGTAVTITGLERFNIEAVFFNDAEAETVTVDGDGIVHAVTPSDATTGPVKVVTHRGTLTTSEEFKVLDSAELEDVEITFDPDSGPPGTVVTIAGLDTLSAESVFFNETEAEDFAVDDEGLIKATVPTGAESGPIRVTTNPGEFVSEEEFEVTEVDDSSPSPSDPSISECMDEWDAHAATDFGPLTADATDSATIEANTSTINSAISEVGQAGGGTICLPAGTYHVAPPDLYASGRNVVSIRIDHDNITLWGAGRNDDGQGTALYSRGEYSVIDGSVVRGHGLRIAGSRQNIVLRDFELNGQSGYTGNFDWPANTDTGDGWDTSHKGIVISWDDGFTDDVTLRRVAVRSFKGEMIYTGGRPNGVIRLDEIISEDTNASTYNIHGHITTTNSRFGLSRFWAEVHTAFGDASHTFKNNHFHDAHVNHAITLTGGDLSEVPITFEDNRVETCGFDSSSSQYAFAIGNGTAGPVEIKNNRFTDCGLFQSVTTPAGDGTARNVVFEGNTLTGIINRQGFQFGTGIRDFTIRNNHFEWDSSNQGDAWSYAGGEYAGLIEGNTFVNERFRPVNHGSSPDGVFFSRDNTFSGSSFRSVERNISSSDPTPIILHEEAEIRPDEDGLEVYLPVGSYPDGQEILVFGHSSRAAHFRSGNPTYDVSEDIYVVGGRSGTTLTLRYDASRELWVEAR